LSQTDKHGTGKLLKHICHKFKKRLLRKLIKCRKNIILKTQIQTLKTFLTQRHVLDHDIFPGWTTLENKIDEKSDEKNLVFTMKIGLKNMEI
jgi:N-glycosylase/DNA lyase